MTGISSYHCRSFTLAMKNIITFNGDSQYCLRNNFYANMILKYSTQLILNIVASQAQTQESRVQGTVGFTNEGNNVKTQDSALKCLNASLILFH